MEIESPVADYIENDYSYRADIANDERFYSITKNIFDDLDAVHNKFENAILNYYYNIEQYKGNQWSDIEKLKFATQMRYPYVFNEIFNKVDAVTGMQQKMRFDAKCIGRESGDDDAVTQLNNLLKWCEQINDIEYTESEIFFDTIVGGVGCSVNRYEKEDVDKGYPVLERVPPDEMKWDLRSKRLDGKDMRWMARTRYLTETDALELLPQFKEIIETAAKGVAGMESRRPVLSERMREILDANNKFYSKGKGIINLIEYYEKKKVYKYTVADEIESKIMEFDKYDEAQAYYDGEMDRYIEDGVQILNDDGSYKLILTDTAVNGLWQTIIIGDTLVKHTLTSLDDFPYTLCYGYFVNGEYWSFIDQLIDPQLWFNRYISQWDYIVGTGIKGMVTVRSNLLKNPMTAEQIRREVSKTAALFEVQSHEAIMQHPPVQVNPALFQGIELALNRMNDYAGGRNLLGLQENAAESGRAVQLRAEQGGMSKIPLFDKLRLWRKQVTYKLVWYLKNFMTPGQILRVIGSDKDVQLVKIDDMLMNTLREIKYDIIVDEVVKTESVKERYFLALRDLFTQVTNIPDEIKLNLMLEFIDLPRTQKDEIRSQIQFYTQYMQQQAQEGQQKRLEQQVKDSLYKTKVKEQMERAEELQEAQGEVEKQKLKMGKQIEEMQQMAAEQASMPVNEPDEKTELANAMARTLLEQVQ